MHARTLSSDPTIQRRLEETELAPVLTDFSMRRPAYEVDQRRALDWIAQVHAAAESTLANFSTEERTAFEARTRRILERCACNPSQIGSRGHGVPDIGNADFEASSIYDVLQNPRGKGTEARSRWFADVVSNYFDLEYAEESSAPSDVIHVTCTGYVSPSAPQELVARKGWGETTRVTHAYHMGCYAAFPAARIAEGALRRAEQDHPSRPARVDIVHTELCSLHLDPSDHSMEQLVVQSLFGDGFIRYSMRSGGEHRGLSLLAKRETIIPDTSDSMTWITTDAGMKMTLARDVPNQIASALRDFVSDLYGAAGRVASDDLGSTIVAVHPGGPRIIDRVRDVLELDEAQVRASREVLFDYGNMSSATLPHIWMRLLENDDVPAGAQILSLAFGPGLTVCGALFEKR